MQNYFCCTDPLISVWFRAPSSSLIQWAITSASAHAEELKVDGPFALPHHFKLLFRPLPKVHVNASSLLTVIKSIRQYILPRRTTFLDQALEWLQLSLSICCGLNTLPQRRRMASHRVLQGECKTGYNVAPYLTRLAD
jgi:hypothetical protein